MPVLNITGSLSPHIDDTVTFNGRLEPTKTNWMKVVRKLNYNFITTKSLQLLLDQRLRFSPRGTARKVGGSI